MGDEDTKSHYVDCRPNPEDPNIVERRHRANCLVGTFQKCQGCKNRLFKLNFNIPEKKLEQVLCPRWNKGDRELGKMPVSYVPTENATCTEKPFEFCPSCPSQESLEELGIDKGVDGWYERWTRFKKEADDGS